MILQPVIPVGWIVFLTIVPAGLLVWQLIRTRTWRERWSPIRRLGALALLLAALLGPALASGGTTKEVVSDVDVIIVMDTTTSSNAEDEGGGRTRLDLMKDDVRALTDDYPGARFALITFDSSASLRVPLVNDSNALLSYLQDLTVEVTDTSSGSSPYEADKLVARTLVDARDNAPNHLRLVFYLGDGETTANDPTTTDFLAPKGLFDAGRVYGYGTTAGGPMRQNSYQDYQGAFDGTGDGPPDPTATPTPEPYVVDPSTGQPAISRIDEDTLRSIATDLGVDYVHRTPGTKPAFPAVDTQLGKTIEVPNETIEARLYWVPVIPAFLLIAWDLLIGWRAFTELRRARPRAGAGE